MQLLNADIKSRARGRWRGILSGLGMEAKFLRDKHGPCPMCGGTDRWRWDDKGGDGTYFCSGVCGAGNGVDLVIKWKGITFAEAKREIEGQIGTAPVVVAKAARDDSKAREAMAALWKRCNAMDGQDIASRYLRSRGIALPPSAPSVLRWIGELEYREDASRVVSYHPAMLAKFVAPDDKSATLHRTWLAEPGVKANVAKPRKLMAGQAPDGGAVRLGAASETMGIAEGLETAMSAAQFFDITVWSALTAGAMVKWKPPKDVAKNIIICGDTDSSFAGQNAAYALAYRLKTEGFGVEVRFTQYYDTGQKDDWNSALEAQMRDAA